MKIRMVADAGSAASEAAKLIAGEAREAVRDHGFFVMAVSGGRTPWIMLRVLALEDLPWSAVHVLQVDERIALAGDFDRNLTHLRESLLEHAPLPPRQIYPMPVDHSDLAAACAQYAQTLQLVAGSPPVLDFVHLGLGPDGHTASLIPGDPVRNLKDRDVALTGPYQGRRRMTLTYPILNRARQILWLVTGSEKAEMLAQMVAGNPSIPASQIRRDVAVVIADRAAASRLGDNLKPRWLRQRGSGPGFGGKVEVRTLKGGIMRIGIAADHGGFALKEDLRAQLAAAGHDVLDFGSYKLDPSDDFPNFVIPLSQAVASGKVERGIAVCSSGVGAAICANKIPGVRASLINDHYSAGQGVEDDHMNVICLGGRIIGSATAWDLINTFLSAHNSQAERFLRRLGEIAALETKPGNAVAGPAAIPA